MRWMIAAVALGIATGELLSHMSSMRVQVARVAGRSDVALLEAAAEQPVDAAAIDREMQLLHAQFGTADRYQKALQQSRLDEATLREKVTAQLREIAWIESRIAPELQTTEGELRAWFAAHATAFALPQCYHVAHIFLAAHADTPPEVTEQKREAIRQIADELRGGADFAQLAAACSEDEATKHNGGDLGWLSSSRVSPEIFAAIAQLRAGQTSGPFQSHLGFHIFRLIDPKQERAPAFDEARGIAAAEVLNEKRRSACDRIAQQLAATDYRALR